MSIFLAKQGIYNSKKQIVAYELLYRNSYKNYYDTSVEENYATLQIVSNILNIGKEKLIEDKKAFINFPKECLINGLVNTLSKDNVVVEILENVKPTKEVKKKIKELKDEGYIIALDDVTLNIMYEEFADLIHIYKIDFIDTTKEDRKEILYRIKNINPKAKFLAEKIESKRDYEEAFYEGYSYFQGYYLSKPIVIQE